MSNKIGTDPWILTCQNALGVAKIDIRPSGVEPRKRDPLMAPMSPDLHLEDRTRETLMGHPRTKSKRESGPCKNKRQAMLGT